MPTLEYFEKRERELLGDVRFAALYKAPRDAAEKGITVNGLRVSPEAFAKMADFPLHASPFCPTAFVLEDAAFRPGRHPYYHAGAFYSQEPSASAPAALLGVRPGMKVLDCCAAPGGKSSQLAAALKGEGLLVCNEFVSARADILKANLERMGVPNAVVLNEDTARIAAVLPGFFDRVLVDAPCSGEGMFRKEPQAMAQHNEGLVRQCTTLGESILENAAACLAPGGEMVYSTCTFAPQEDEGQIGAFLARHPEFSLLPTTEAFGSPGEENRLCGYTADVSLMRRIWPCQGGEGHFFARLQKNEGEPFAVPRKPAKERRAKPVPEWEAFAEEYFPALPELRARPVTRLEDTLLLSPGLPGGEKLHLVRAGVRVGTMQKGRFVPEHHLFAVWGAQCANREQLTLADPRTAAWLRGEEIEAVTAQKGWCAVLVDGLALGMGKMSGGKIKNHYPKALRNLK